MMSLALIQQMADERAEIAASRDLKPYIPFNAEEIDRWTRFPFPNIGSYHRPAGWELTDELFCDKQGFGAENEPALTHRQLKERIKEYDAMDDTFGFAIIEEGQFQFILGVFKQTED